jgi:N-hydroxyarylamine O-acetyltransferase
MDIQPTQQQTTYHPLPLTTTQLQTYLERIGVEGPVTVDRQGLTRLHRAHLLNVTWEAIDCFMGWPTSLDPAAAHAKIVHGGRGGWCYEMNGLFGAALQALGFRSSGLPAASICPSSAVRPLATTLLSGLISIAHSWRKSGSLMP